MVPQDELPGLVHAVRGTMHILHGLCRGSLCSTYFHGLGVSRHCGLACVKVQHGLPLNSFQGQNCRKILIVSTFSEAIIVGLGAYCSKNHHSADDGISGNIKAKSALIVYDLLPLICVVKLL